MIIGTGIDIVELNRIRKLLERQEEAFLSRILTAEERGMLPQAAHRRVELAAGRFSVKEAFAKAVGTGIGERLSWQDIAVLPDESGKPQAVLSERAAALLPPSVTVHLSISHSREYCVSHVIIERPS